jgi:hypothetical protein
VRRFVLLLVLVLVVSVVLPGQSDAWGRAGGQGLPGEGSQVQEPARNLAVGAPEGIGFEVSSAPVPPDPEPGVATPEGYFVPRTVTGPFNETGYEFVSAGRSVASVAVTATGLYHLFSDPGANASGCAVWYKWNATHQPVLSATGQLEATYSYMLGDNSTTWEQGLNTYTHVTVTDLWEGVNATFSGAEGGALKYEFSVAEETPISVLAWNVSGPDNLTLSDHTNLTLGLPWTYIHDSGLTAWDSGGVAPVGFVLDGGNVSFEFTSAWDRSGTLVVDPLIYCSYLGGNVREVGYAVTGDRNKLYVTGRAGQGTFPTTPGAYNETHSGGYDVFVTCFGANGSYLEWSTFVGSASTDDEGWGIEVDGDGYVHVAGWSAGNFPATATAYDFSFNGNQDAVYFVLSPDGASLNYSTFLGHNGLDRAYDLALDRLGETAFVAGYTASSAFPTTSGAVNETKSGNDDMFLARVRPSGGNATDLWYSTFFGGSGFEVAWGVAVNGSDDAVVVGETTSTNVPMVSWAMNGTAKSGKDALVLVVNASGAGEADLLGTTYLGTSGDDIGYGAAVSNSGIYVTGEVKGADLPVSPDAYDSSYGAGSDAFLHKLHLDLSDMTYGTYLGGTGLDTARAVAYRPGTNDSVCLTGQAQSSDFPVVDFQTDYNITDTNDGYGDVFFTIFNDSLSGLLYSTFLGTGGTDYAESGYDVACDSVATAYATGLVNGANFETTAGAYDTSFNGGTWDAYVFRFHLFDVPTNLSFGTPTYDVAIDFGSPIVVYVNVTTSGDLGATVASVEATIWGQSYPMTNSTDQPALFTWTSPLQRTVGEAMFTLTATDSVGFSVTIGPFAVTVGSLEVLRAPDFRTVTETVTVVEEEEESVPPPPPDAWWYVAVMLVAAAVLAFSAHGLEKIRKLPGYVAWGKVPVWFLFSSGIVGGLWVGMAIRGLFNPLQLAAIWLGVLGWSWLAGSMRRGRMMWKFQPLGLFLGGVPAFVTVGVYMLLSDLTYLAVSAFVAAGACGAWFIPKQIPRVDVAVPRATLVRSVLMAAAAITSVVFLVLGLQAHLAVPELSFSDFVLPEGEGGVVL